MIQSKPWIYSLQYLKILIFILLLATSTILTITNLFYESVRGLNHAWNNDYVISFSIFGFRVRHWEISGLKETYALYSRGIKLSKTLHLQFQRFWNMTHAKLHLEVWSVNTKQLILCATNIGGTPLFHDFSYSLASLLFCSLIPYQA